MADYTTFSDGSVTSGLAEQRGWKLEFENIPTGHKVHFKAFITQYSEAYTSEWEAVDAYGRMDPIMTFRKTGRTVSLGWDVIAESADDAKENLSRVNMLIKMLYPVYKDGYLAGSPLFKFQFANLVSDQDSGIICTLNGLSYQPDTEDHGFVDPGTGQLYPKKISLSTEITVLHTFHVGWDTEGNWGHPQDAQGENWPFYSGAQGTSNSAATSVSATDAQNAAQDLADTLSSAQDADAQVADGATSEEPTE